MRHLPLICAGLFFVLFVGLPLAVMGWSTVDGAEGIDFSAFAQILADPVDRSQLWYSLQLGIAATAVALLFGGGHAFLTHGTDVPGARWLGPLGVAPLAVPPILVAMGYADLMDVAGFGACAALLGIAYAPFVAVLAARGLRGVDGRLYEAALLSRGRGRAELLLLRTAAPEIAAGCLFAFLFVISEHGVPEFLTVKGKTWHTYAEGVFARWTRRATGVSHEDLVGPIVAALPLILLVAVALALALRLRAHTNLRPVQPMPLRRLGGWRFPAMLLPLGYLTLGIGVPVVVMGRWAAGSTQVDEAMSLDNVRENFQAALSQGGGDLSTTILVSIAAALVAIAVAVPIATFAAGGRPQIQHWTVLPIAVPAILLGMGLVQVFNSRILVDRVYGAVGDFYDSTALLACGFAARMLPFGVLTLTHAIQRQPASLEEAARLTGRGTWARFRHIRLPLIAPAVWSALCLVFVLCLRELDLAVVLPAGNDTVVRRLSNVVHFGGEDMGGALALMLLCVAVLVPLLTVLITGRKLTALS